MDTDDSALRKIGRIGGFTWDWAEDASADARAAPTTGVIAQQVADVFPELVDRDADGFMRVDYIGLIGPLIEAVKELDTRLRALEERLDRDATNAARGES